MVTRQICIAKLPDDVWLMSVSEWHLPISRGGIESAVGEYSISSVGPGPRAVPHWHAAQARGLKRAPRFSSTTPAKSPRALPPVMNIVAEHCNNLLTKANLDAMFIGWTMGGHPSPNIELAQRLSRKPAPSIDTVLNEIAAERYGAEGAPLARQAWTGMSEAFREYPFHIAWSTPALCNGAPPTRFTRRRRATAPPCGASPMTTSTAGAGPIRRTSSADQFEKVARLEARHRGPLPKPPPPRLTP